MMTLGGWLPGELKHPTEWIYSTKEEPLDGYDAVRMGLWTADEEGALTEEEWKRGLIWLASVTTSQPMPADVREFLTGISRGLPVEEAREIVERDRNSPNYDQSYISGIQCEAAELLDRYPEPDPAEEPEPHWSPAQIDEQGDVVVPHMIRACDGTCGIPHADRPHTHDWPVNLP